VEGAQEHGPVANRDRMIVIGGENLDVRPAALDPWGADEDGAQRLGSQPGDREVGLEAL
jgi:hypothetical protein